MTQEQARQALAFLQRTELKGAEAATLVNVQSALLEIAQGRAHVVRDADTKGESE